MFLVAFANFVSHFIMPELLMYSKQIKLVNTANLIIVGAMCLFVLVYYRVNEAANFCTGSHLSEEEKALQMSRQDREFLIERGGFLWLYTSIVITTSVTFILAMIAFCFFNLKKMGF